MAIGNSKSRSEFTSQKRMNYDFKSYLTFFHFGEQKAEKMKRHKMYKTK